MVHVENMAYAHILAASRCGREEGWEDGSADGVTHAGGRVVGRADGQAFNIADFDQNIVCLYHQCAGVPPPHWTLPYWLLHALVKCAVALAVALHTLFGYQLLKPKTGLTEAALTAGLEATMDCSKAKSLLGYAPRVTRGEAVASCLEWVRAGGAKEARTGSPPQITPIIGHVRPQGWAGNRKLGDYDPELEHLYSGFRDISDNSMR